MFQRARERLIKLCVLLTFLASVLGVASPEVSKSGTEVLPWSIAPIIILQGSNYEMGYQYYQQIGQMVGKWLLETYKRELSSEEMENLYKNEKYLKEYTPQLIDYFKGMAKGATDVGVSLSYEEVLAKFIGTITYPDEECSAFSAWENATIKKDLIAANSMDGGFGYIVTLVAFPEEGNRWISITRIGGLAGGHPGINNKGLFIGASGGHGVRPEDKGGYGIPRSCHYTSLLQYSDSAKEAKDTFLSWKHVSAGGGGASYLFSDVTGDAYVVEWTRSLKSVRKPGDFGEEDFIYSTNNFFNDEMIPACKKTKFMEHAGRFTGSTSAVARNMELWNMLHNYHGGINLDFVKMMWRFPGKGLPCFSGGPWPEGEEQEKILSYGRIANLDNAFLAITLPDNGDQGVAYISTGPAAKIAYPLGGDRHYQIANTYTFYKLHLASSPAAVANAAKQDAVCQTYQKGEAYIAKSHSELKKLTYTDPGYVYLNDLFSKSVAEFYRGENAHTKARLTSGNKALFFYSKATTAFTRAQSFALQVYNHLVPPATSPEELDLRNYGGPWAEWLDLERQP